MQLNDLKPAQGSKKLRNRVGRGHSSGNGKTCGRGIKGQKSRSGGMPKPGFEGGQMPLQRRLPKRGFRSRTSPLVAELRLDTLDKSGLDTVDLASLKAAGLLNGNTIDCKIIGSGEITRAVKIVGLRSTASAAKAIEAAGGSVGSE